MIELFADKPLGEAETFQRSLAGDTLNILVAAARMGSSTGYVTRVGKDHFTSYLLGAWRNEGIDVSRVRQEEGFNAVHFVALLPDGDREFIYYRRGSAATTMQPSDLDRAYIASTKVLHVSGITQAISASSRATALKAAQIAAESGVAVSYDPNYRHQLWSTQEARRGMEEIMPYVTYFSPSVPSDSEALFDTADPREVVEQGLQSRGRTRDSHQRRRGRGDWRERRRVRGRDLLPGACGGYDGRRRRLQGRHAARHPSGDEHAGRGHPRRHRRRAQDPRTRSPDHHAPRRRGLRSLRLLER